MSECCWYVNGRVPSSARSRAADHGAPLSHRMDQGFARVDERFAKVDERLSGREALRRRVSDIAARDDQQSSYGRSHVNTTLLCLLLFLPALATCTTTRVAPAAANDSSFLAFLQRWETAQSRFINGDPTSWKQSASHRADATILGAFGGYGEKGWEVVGARYDWASSQYRESGATMRVEYLNIGVSGDLAFTVGIEHQTGARVAGQPSTRALRATQVFRREAGAWKLLHRHADPLMEKRAP